MAEFRGCLSCWTAENNVLRRSLEERKGNVNWYFFTEVYYTWELNVHAKSFQISNFWLIEFTIFVHAHVYAFLQSTCLTLISMSFVYHTQSSSRLTAVDQSTSNASFKKSRAPVACKDSVMFSRTWKKYIMIIKAIHSCSVYK